MLPSSPSLSLSPPPLSCKPHPISPRALTPTLLPYSLTSQCRLQKKPNLQTRYSCPPESLGHLRVKPRAGPPRPPHLLLVLILRRPRAPPWILIRPPRTSNLRLLGNGRPHHNYPARTRQPPKLQPRPLDAPSDRRRPTQQAFHPRSLQLRSQQWQEVGERARPQPICQVQSTLLLFTSLGPTTKY